jgi:hypothetical protein
MTKNLCLAGALAMLMAFPAIAVSRPTRTPDDIQDMVPPPFRGASPERLLKADCVVLGRVLSLEPEPALAAAAPDDVYQSVFRIALIKVSERISGAEGVQELRVGFRPVNQSRHRHLELAVGDEGCFFLKRHPEQAFFMIQFGSGVNRSATPEPLFLRPDGLGYAKEIELVRRCGQLLQNPREGLTAGSAESRLLAAALLVKRYRGDRNPLRWLAQGGLVTEPIDAEESRLILSALSEANLTASHSDSDVSPLGVFGQLGLGSADGWQDAQNRSTIPEQASAWLKTHLDTYRIKRVWPIDRKTWKDANLATVLVGISSISGEAMPLRFVTLFASQNVSAPPVGQGPGSAYNTFNPPGRQWPGNPQPSPIGSSGAGHNTAKPQEPEAETTGWTWEQKFCCWIAGVPAGLAILYYVGTKVVGSMRARHSAALQALDSATTGPFASGTGTGTGKSAKRMQGGLVFGSGSTPAGPTTPKKKKP